MSGTDSARAGAGKAKAELSSESRPFLPFPSPVGGASPQVAGMSMIQPTLPEMDKQCRLPWGPGLGACPALLLWALAWQIPQTLPRLLPEGWHKGKDKFQNARPPVCGNSNCLWLPEACHQGTTCCPIGCLALVAAAQHY